MQVDPLEGLAQSAFIALLIAKIRSTVVFALPVLGCQVVVI